MNGEFVSSLLVNGKDFFSGDPKIALNNLSAYTVNKIKVYHKNPKTWCNEERTEEVRKRSLFVMDGALKHEYAQGWLANFEMAGAATSKEALMKWNFHFNVPKELWPEVKLNAYYTHNATTSSSLSKEYEGSGDGVGNFYAPLGSAACEQALLYQREQQGDSHLNDWGGEVTLSSGTTYTHCRLRSARRVWYII